MADFFRRLDRFDSQFQDNSRPYRKTHYKNGVRVHRCEWCDKIIRPNVSRNRDAVKNLCNPCYKKWDRKRRKTQNELSWEEQFQKEDEEYIKGLENGTRERDKEYEKFRKEKIRSEKRLRELYAILEEQRKRDVENTYKKINSLRSRKS